MKKIIFFDGDGTLWYPSKTKYTVAPHWVYMDETIKNHELEFEVTPTAVETLTKLGAMDIKRVLISTTPLVEAEGLMHRIKIVKHLDIHKLLDDVQVAPDYPKGKGEKIIALLEKYGLKTQDALMVGDSYVRDYEAANRVGVEALHIDSDYGTKARENSVPEDRIIQNLSQVIDHLE